MKTVIFNEQLFALGLQWRSLIGDGGKSEVRQVSKDRGAAFGAIRTITDEGGARLQVGLTESRALVGVPSAASVLADIDSNIILVEQLDANSYWVCAIIDSEIIPGSDVLVSIEDLPQKIVDLTELLNDSDQDYRYCTSDSVAALLGVDEYENVVFEDLLGSADFSSKDFRSHKVTKLNQNTVKILVGLLVVALVGVGIYANQTLNAPISDEEMSWEMPPPIQDDASANEALQNERYERIRAARKAALSQEENWLYSYLTQIDSAAAINSIIESSRAYPQIYHGWKQGAILWDKNTTGNFFLRSWVLDEEGMSSLPVLQLSMHDAGEVAADLTGDKANTSHGIQLFAKRLERPVLDIIKDPNHHYPILIHELKTMDLEWSMALTEDFQRPELIDGISDHKKAAQWIYPIRRIDLSTDGDSVSSLRDFMVFVHNHPNIIINQLILDVSNESWSFTGVVYEHEI